MMNANFNKMLNGEYLIPKFIDQQSDYYINYLKTGTVPGAKIDDMSALVSTIIFNNHGVVIPFQYKLSDEQFKNYEKNKNSHLKI